MQQVGVINKIIIIFFFFLHGLGRLTCSGIDALPSFPGASTISSSSRSVVEGVFRESGVAHSFKVVDPVLFVFESHVLYSRISSSFLMASLIYIYIYDYIIILWHHRRISGPSLT